MGQGEHRGGGLKEISLGEDETDRQWTMDNREWMEELVNERVNE